MDPDDSDLFDVPYIPNMDNVGQDGNWIFFNSDHTIEDGGEADAEYAANFLMSLDENEIPTEEDNAVVADTENPNIGGEHEQALNLHEDHAVPRVPQQSQNKRPPRQPNGAVRRVRPPGTYNRATKGTRAPVARGSRGRAASANQEVPRPEHEEDEFRRARNRKALVRHRAKKSDYLKFAPGEIDYKKSLRDKLERHLLNLDNLIKELHFVPAM